MKLAYELRKTADRVNFDIATILERVEDLAIQASNRGEYKMEFYLNEIENESKQTIMSRIQEKLGINCYDHPGAARTLILNW